MHILPDLDALEKKYSPEDGLVVVSEHLNYQKYKVLISNLITKVIKSYRLEYTVQNLQMKKTRKKFYQRSKDIT